MKGVIFVTVFLSQSGEPLTMIIDMNLFKLLYQRNADMFQNFHNSHQMHILVTVQLDADGYEHGPSKTPVICVRFIDKM